MPGARRIADSLRLRLVLLLALCLAPIALVSGLQAINSYRSQQAQMREALLQSARLAVEEEGALFASTERLLKALGSSEAVARQRAPACGEEIDLAIRSFAEYAEAGVVTPDGFLHCTGDGVPRRVPSVISSGWYERVASGRSFVISGPTVGDLSEIPVLVTATPIRRDTAFLGAVVVGIRLSWFDRWTRYYGLPADAVVHLIDARGRPLTRSPEAAASKLPVGGLPVDALGAETHTFRAEAADGQRRFYALAPVYGDEISVLFGVPSGNLIGWMQVDLLNRLVAPAAMWLAALIAAWFAVDRFVLRWIRQLGRATRAYALGRYDAPRDFSAAPGELRDLGERFNVMADVIRARTHELEASLTEKETLITEIHHRVKNNLQTITSLLSLQSRRLARDQDRRVLADAQGRINALALIHRSIYETDDLDSVRLSDFLGELCRQVQEITGRPGGRVSVTVDVPDITITQEKAVPLALLVNEAVTNALKHAFVDGRRGRVRVAVARASDRMARPARVAAGGDAAGDHADQPPADPLPDGATGDPWILSITDDGIGFDSEASTGDSGIGRSLLDAFAVQLGGTLDVESGPGGTRTTVIIPSL
ncbi:MAG: histidine kinase dimerization/phosphoacceptor domain -containing protein [Azospirillaceae bacterium]